VASPFPVAAHRSEAARLARVVRRVVPVLRFMERFVRPRWAAPAGATERAMGGVLLLLLAAVPLSNVRPALAIAPATAVIAFAHLEEDGRCSASRRRRRSPCWRSPPWRFGRR
jgi:hypothetical protein